MQPTASCITCHSRAGIGAVDGQPSGCRFLIRAPTPRDPHSKRGFIGVPAKSGLKRPNPKLDFVWSMSKAKPQHLEQKNNALPTDFDGTVCFECHVHGR